VNYSSIQEKTAGMGVIKKDDLMKTTFPQKEDNPTLRRMLV
jgi:hypothetical protein